MNRIKKLFSNTKAYIGYVTAGDGGIQRTLDSALALIAGGVNMLEIGVPFSDPIADGPVIQRASARALKSKTTMQDILNLVKNIREHSDIPLILFSYFNPLLTAIKSNFLQQAKRAGIDGILIVDCPMEESQDFHRECLTAQLAPIYVITPSTPNDRIKKIDQHGHGFLYYACRKGTTGIRNTLPEDFSEKMINIKSLSHLPVVVGFGISQRNMAEQVLAHADGVVVGSLFIKAIEDGNTPAQLTALAQQINPIGA